MTQPKPSPQDQLQLIHVQLKRVEFEIDLQEEDYIGQTNSFGNIIIGFKNYIANKKVTANWQEPALVNNQQRLFSLSSALSSVSKKFEKEAQYCQKQDSPQRITKDILQRQQQILEKIQPSCRQWSVDSLVCRGGSLKEDHKTLKYPSKRYRSESYSLRTLSQHSNFHSYSTETLPEFKARLRDRKNLESDISSIPHQKRKKRRTVSSQQQLWQNKASSCIGEQILKGQSSRKEMINQKSTPSEQYQQYQGQQIEGQFHSYPMKVQCLGKLQSSSLGLHFSPDHSDQFLEDDQPANSGDSIDDFINRAHRQYSN